MKIAIVGTGVSGLVAAHMLHPHHEITVFESDTRIGGHANTVDVEVDGRSVAVDTGFIVYNDRNYPGFRALLDRLGVATQPTEMSFSVSDPRTGLEFRGSNLNAIFAQRRNLANPSFLRLLADITRFNRAARRLVAGETRWNGPDRLPDGGGFDAHAEESLADFVRRGRFSQSFVRQFLIPFGASIWSADPATFMRFPVRAYARFMDNHGLLELAGRPEWRTVTGGSRRYVEALTAPFSHRIHLGMPVHKIVTHDGVGGSQLVEVLTDRGPELFDRVIVATHSDQALRMLADASTAEREVLGAIGYQRNIATLHTDERMLPRNPRAGELELRDRREHARNHGHLLDEPPAVDRDSTTLARHAEPPRRDRPPHADHEAQEEPHDRHHEEAHQRQRRAGPLRRGGDAHLLQPPRRHDVLHDAAGGEQRGHHRDHGPGDRSAGVHRPREDGRQHQQRAGQHGKQDPDQADRDGQRDQDVEGAHDAHPVTRGTRRRADWSATTPTMPRATGPNGRRPRTEVRGRRRGGRWRGDQSSVSDTGTRRSPSLCVSSTTLAATSRSLSPCSRAWWAQNRSSPPDWSSTRR